jgi:group I intron endonuclease
MIGIYKITSPTGRIYIGQSVDIENRFRSYKRLDCKGQKKLYRSLCKYGVNSHIFEIETECTVNDLNRLERDCQELYKCMLSGLNCCLVGTEDKKFVHSKESKDAISKSRTGIIFTDAHRENIRRVRTGTKTPQKTKDILRAKSIAAGCKPPSWKGKTKTADHMSNIANALRGRYRSDVENKNTSNSMLNTVLPYSTVVYDPNTGVYYYSIRDAARTINVCHTKLGRDISKGQSNLKIV